MSSGGCVKPRSRTRTRTRSQTASARGVTADSHYTSTEAISSPAVKRTKVAVASNAEPVSAKAFFQNLAAGWIKKEESWYRKLPNGYKPNDNQGNKKVAINQLEKALDEYINRFVFCIEEEKMLSPTGIHVPPAFW